MKDEEPWEAYDELLQECNSIEALKNRLAAMETEEAKEDAMVTTAETRNLRAKNSVLQEAAVDPEDWLGRHPGPRLCCVLLGCDRLREVGGDRTIYWR